MTPLTTALLVAAVATAITWVSAVVGRVGSGTPRVWPVIPMVYLLIFATAADFADVRVDVMGLLVVLWGVRLTFQFVRRGGYAGRHEGRFENALSRVGAQRFPRLVALGICVVHNAILLSITLPAYTALKHGSTLFAGEDAALTFAFLLSLVGETVADQQQWVFHEEKRTAQDGDANPSPGFLATGLWRLSRHPNFFFGGLQWWIIFLFGAVSAGSVLQWTIVGAIALTGQFVVASIFTESLLTAKYAQYAAYRARTSAVIPWPPRRVRAVSEESGESGMSPT